MGDKAGFWKGHFAAWAESGLTQAVYCQQHDLNLHSFGYWRSRLGASVKATPRSAGVLPIKLAEGGGTDQVIVVRLPNGLSVDLPVAMNSTRWLPMIRALRAC
ncbi:MAG: hypothetical protein L0H29_04975 [Sinobacteraceae bacterium]|nr:hypothetical protein [Nevskiaceae bacterium]